MSTSTSPLYDLAARHRAIFERIEDADGELTPELEAELDESSADLVEKVEACCRHDVNLGLRAASLGGQIAAVQAELDRLYARRDRECLRPQESLRAYVQRCLEAAKQTRVETENFSVRLQANPASAVWTGDKDAIPERFMRLKTTIEFDKTRALNAAREGEALPEGVEIRRSMRLVIK